MTGTASGLQFAVYPPKGVTIKKITRGDVVKLRDEEDEYVFTFRTGDRPEMVVLFFATALVFQQKKQVL